MDQEFYRFLPNIGTVTCRTKNSIGFYLGRSINGLVTDGNTMLCCRGFHLPLFQSTTANKVDSEHTQDYKRLLSVFEAEILRVTVKRIDVFSSIMLISGDFWLNVPKIAKKGT